MPNKDKLYRHGNYEKSGFDDWTTPLHVIRDLEIEFGKLHDPCPRDWKRDTHPNGLHVPWSLVFYNFVNPPYSDIKNWVKKCFHEWERGSGVLLLIPPRTDTKYFHEYIYNNAHLRFYKGRLKFGKGSPKPAPAPFPSMLCIFPRISDYVSQYDVNDKEVINWAEKEENRRKQSLLD